MACISTFVGYTWVSRGNGLLLYLDHSPWLPRAGEERISPAAIIVVIIVIAVVLVMVVMVVIIMVITVFVVVIDTVTVIILVIVHIVTVVTVNKRLFM